MQSNKENSQAAAAVKEYFNMNLLQGKKMRITSYLEVIRS
jgi:hypothetical protein